MERDLEYGKTAQLNSIHRCRHFCVENPFKSVQPDAATSLFKHSTSALKVEQNFPVYSWKTDWPAGLQNLQDNFLKTTILHEKLTKDCGKDSNITPALLKDYERQFPAQADRLRWIGGAEFYGGMSEYLIKGSIPNQPFYKSHEESHSADGAMDEDTVFRYSTSDSDNNIAPVRLKYSVDDCLSYLTGFGISFQKQT